LHEDIGRQIRCRRIAQHQRSKRGIRDRRGRLRSESFVLPKESVSRT
jgi:hypothetical protein